MGKQRYLKTVPEINMCSCYGCVFHSDDPTNKCKDLIDILNCGENETILKEIIVENINNYRIIAIVTGKQLK